jgi:hypothetical protein
MRVKTKKMAIPRLRRTRSLALIVTIFPIVKPVPGVAESWAKKA